MAIRTEITDRTSLTNAIIDVWVACWMAVRSFVSRDTRWPVVSRVRRAKSEPIRWAKAAFCMSVVMRMTIWADATWCR